MGIVLHGDSKGTGKTEVCKFEDPVFGDQQILGLQVSVQDSVFVAVVDSIEQLVEKAFDCCRVKALVSRGIEQLLQVLVQVLKHKGQLSVCVNDVTKFDDVRVLKLLEESDFSDGCRRNAFILRFQSDLLQSDQFLGGLVCC